MEKPATRATARYHKKIGLISKSYKLNRKIAEMFAEACENIGTTQAKELTEFMKTFIRTNHPDHDSIGCTLYPD